MKACPFCGGEATLCDYVSNDDKKWFYIVCGDCGVVTDHVSAREIAVRIWNTRPEEERLKAENDRLKKILKIVKGGLVYKRYLAQLEEDAQMYQWSKGLIELINAPDTNVGTNGRKDR